MGKLPCEAAREAVVTHTHLGGEPPELASVLGNWDILQGPCRGFPYGLQMAIFLLCPQRTSSLGFSLCCSTFSKSNAFIHTESGLPLLISFKLYGLQKPHLKMATKWLIWDFHRKSTGTQFQPRILSQALDRGAALWFVLQKSGGGSSGLAAGYLSWYPPYNPCCGVSFAYMELISNYSASEWLDLSHAECFLHGVYHLVAQG